MDGSITPSPGLPTLADVLSQRKADDPTFPDYENVLDLNKYLNFTGKLLTFTIFSLSEYPIN